MRISSIILATASLAMAAPRQLAPLKRSVGNQHQNQHLPLVPRGIFPTPKSVKSGKTISASLKMVASKVDDLDKSVKVVMGPMGAAALGDVATKGAGLGDVIQKAQTTIGKQDETDLIGALDISDSADGLTKSLDGLSDDLIAIEPTVRAAGLNGAVVDILMQQQGNSGGLVKAVVSKLPDEAKDLAKMQTMGATMGLDRVITAYKAGMAKGAPPPPAAPAPAAPKSMNATKPTKPAMVRMLKVVSLHR